MSQRTYYKVISIISKVTNKIVNSSLNSSEKTNSVFLSSYDSSRSLSLKMFHVKRFYYYTFYYHFTT